MVKINMEMPTYCYDCPCHNGETGRCNITGDSTCDKRPFDCPLEEEEAVAPIMTISEAVAQLEHEMITLMADAKMPAGDVQEVKHGKWVDRNKGFGGVICSNCKWEDMVLIGDCYHYCPNCGAEMDEEEQ